VCCWTTGPASLLTLSITTADAITDCNPFPPGTCTIQADRSVHVVYDDQPVHPDGPNPGGVRETVVELFRPDGTQMLDRGGAGARLTRRSNLQGTQR